MDRKNWIITAVVAFLALLFSILIGISVRNMTDRAPKEPTETSSDASKESEEVTDHESDPEESVTEPDESQSAVETDPEPAVNFRVPEASEYESIRQSYDQSIKSYYSSAALDANGDPIDVMRFENTFRQCNTRCYCTTYALSKITTDSSYSRTSQ